MTTPVLDRGGLAHGALVGVDRAVRGPLRLGLQLCYAGARPGGDLTQHRIGAAVGAELRFELRPWLALGGDLTLGWVALVETGGGAGGQRGDPAAFSTGLAAGPEVRIVPRLWLRARAGLLVDVFRADEGRRVHPAPALQLQLAL
jgi:hypothetical protein